MDVIVFLDIKEKKEETEIEYLGNKVVKIVRMKLNLTHTQWRTLNLKSQLLFNINAPIS